MLRHFDFDTGRLCDGRMELHSRV